ncbi:MAG: HipA N-terminal domain-containing protein [Pontiellaceae bacterium]|jgi:serine/threonine-protein kinase HipA|nr:HipA N-terminal domain-containing protein [Pontiellaceae bacterium]
MRKGEVRVNGIPAGVLEETATGFRFQYDRDYAQQTALPAVSLTLPKRLDPFDSPVLFAFFAGLLTEGSAMQLQCRILKLDETDLFGRLLKTAQDDVIGNVTVHEIAEGTR